MMRIEYRLELILLQGIDEESQIYLTPSQLECLLGYILKEAAHCMRDTDLKKKEADV